MYSFITRFFLLLGGVLCLSACAGASGPGAGGPVYSDLAHHRYVLESVDGKPFAAATHAPDIEFNENFHISGRACNRYTGRGTLENGVLTVPRMASTKMLCPNEALNAFEPLFASMLAAGAELELDGNTLTLRQGGHVLVYTLRDWVR